MRKWMLIGAISCLLLTACSTQADNNTEVQQLKVENDKLQKEVAQLQQEPQKPCLLRMSRSKYKISKRSLIYCRKGK